MITCKLFINNNQMSFSDQTSCIFINHLQIINNIISYIL